MAKPAWKASNIRKGLDGVTGIIYGRSASESIKADICVRCGKPAVEFTDEISRVEFGISGLCQKCQDFVFAPPPEEEDDGSLSAPDIGVYDDFDDRFDMEG